MTFSYTKLAILLLRVEGIILILEAIPGIAMALIAIINIDGMGHESSYMLATFLQPVIGLGICLSASPLATRTVSFLDREIQ